MDLISTPDLLRWVGALLLTLCFMLIGVYLLQTGKEKLQRHQPSRRLKLLESLALTRTTAVHLLEADNQTFLMTTDPNGTHLHTLKHAAGQDDKPTITRTPK